MTTSANNKTVQPVPLGPTSITWKNFGSYLFHLMLPQAFVLQSAHPVIDAAVGKEKKYKYDPWGRARNSTALLWPVVYARPDKAIEMGHQLRELHREIKGVDKNGNRYFALDPEAYAWVHLTGFDATVRMYKYFAKELSPIERQQAFAEWQQMGALLGIPDRDIPKTEEEYWKEFNRIIEDRLINGEVIQDLLDPKYFRSYPKHPMYPNIPEFVWKALMFFPGLLFHKISIITLPDNFKSKFNIKVSVFDRTMFKLFSGAVRIFYPLLPERMQFISLAYRAMSDARNHPEAYSFEEVDLQQQVAS